MIRLATKQFSKFSLEEVWAEAERIRQHPTTWWAKEFACFEMVSKNTQFSHRPVPANKWFIDWGLPRKTYGGYGLIEVLRFGRTCPTKLTPALCPKCWNPIFSILLKEHGQVGYPLHIRRQCVICGYYEDITIRRDGEIEGTIIFNGQRWERRFGMKDWTIKAPAA